jgi:hypothetical protein
MCYEEGLQDPDARISAVHTDHIVRTISTEKTVLHQAHPKSYVSKLVDVLRRYRRYNEIDVEAQYALQTCSYCADQPDRRWSRGPSCLHPLPSWVCFSGHSLLRCWRSHLGRNHGGHRTRYYLGLQHGLWYMSRCLCHRSFAGSDALRIVDVEDHWR